MDDVEDLSQSVGADSIAIRGFLDNLDLLGLLLNLGDSFLDSGAENLELLLLNWVRGSLDSLLNSLLKAFKISGLDVVSVEDDGFLGLDGLDISEGSNVLLSGNSDLLVDSGLSSSESLDLILSFVMDLEDLLALLGGSLGSEALSNLLLRLLLLLFSSLDLSLERFVLSDSESLLSSSESSKSGFLSLNSLLVSLRSGLVNSDLSLELLNSDTEGLSFVGSSDRSSASADLSLLLAELLGQLDFDSAGGSGFLAFLQFGLNLGEVLQGTSQTLLAGRELSGDLDVSFDSDSGFLLFQHAID